MSRYSSIISTCLVFFVFMVAGADCETGMNDPAMMPVPGSPSFDNTGGDNPVTPANPPAAVDAIVKTNIQLDYRSRLQLGDDLVVYSYHFNDPAIYYFSPSEAISDPANPPEFFVPGSDRLFNTFTFAVAEKKIVMERSTGAVTVFDTVTGSMSDIPAAEVVIVNRPDRDSALDSQPMVADGPYVATINETTETHVRVIDTTGAVPTVINLKDPESVFSPSQVAIDAESRWVVAADSIKGLVFWSLDNPESPQVLEDVAANARPPMQIDGDTVVCHIDSDFERATAARINLSTLTVDAFPDNQCAKESTVAADANRFVYFLLREDADAQSSNVEHFRSVIGNINDPVSPVLASQLDRYPRRPSLVDTSDVAGPCFNEDKLIGYGVTSCITPDGRYTFIGGLGLIDGAWDYIQMSTGGEFTDFPDPEGNTLSGALMGSDLVCNDEVVAFKALREFADGNDCAPNAPDQFYVLGLIFPDRLD